MSTRILLGLLPITKPHYTAHRMLHQQLVFRIRSSDVRSWKQRAQAFRMERQFGRLACQFALRRACTRMNVCPTDIVEHHVKTAKRISQPRSR